MIEIKWILTHIGNIISAIVLGVLGYFSPIANVLTVMVTVILFDQVVGILAARKNGEGIIAEKLWNTGYKLFFSIAIVSMLYAMDTEMSIIQMHRLVAWIIASWELWDILEKSIFLTNHKAFKLIQKYMNERIQDTTGIDMSDEYSEGYDGDDKNS